MNRNDRLRLPAGIGSPANTSNSWTLLHQLEAHGPDGIEHLLGLDALIEDEGDVPRDGRKFRSAHAVAGFRQQRLERSGIQFEHKAGLLEIVGGAHAGVNLADQADLAAVSHQNGRMAGPGIVAVCIRHAHETDTLRREGVEQAFDRPLEVVKVAQGFPAVPGERLRGNRSTGRR